MCDLSDLTVILILAMPSMLAMGFFAPLLLRNNTPRGGKYTKKQRRKIAKKGGGGCW